MLFLAIRVKNRGQSRLNLTQRGYSLTGKTAILHIVILGSSPNISTWEIPYLNNGFMRLSIRNKTTMSARLKQICNSAITPVAVYKNLEAKKKQILTENKGKAGIYKWINHTTGDIYIGSAVDLPKRLLYYIILTRNTLLVIKTNPSFILVY